MLSKLQVWSASSTAIQVTVYSLPDVSANLRAKTDWQIVKTGRLLIIIIHAKVMNNKVLLN